MTLKENGAHKGRLPQLRIGHLTASLPIIQGGMGVRVSLSGLASAVANQGGIGVIAAACIGGQESDATDRVQADTRTLRSEIRKARELTTGIIGVNIMVALADYAELVTAAIDEGVDIIFSGAGLALNLPEYLKGTNRTKLAPIVSSGRAASIICKRWLDKYNYLPDAVVVEGPKAGGHLGFKLEQIADPQYSLEKLVPEVIQALKPFEERCGRPIPVIAAGGIYTGADIYRFLELGAAGVQMATRFVATHECDASPNFKQAYIEASREDIIIINSPVGMPGRAIRNKFIDAVYDGRKRPVKCPYKCLATCDYKTSPYCIALALINAQKGKLLHGLVFAGENAYRVTELMSVKELVDSLVEEYERAALERREAAGLEPIGATSPA